MQGSSVECIKYKTTQKIIFILLKLLFIALCYFYYKNNFNTYENKEKHFLF